MILFIVQYLQKLFSHAFNEALANLAIILVTALVSAGFILLKLYRSKQKMEAAAKFANAVSRSGIDSISYKDGWTHVVITFKNPVKTGENDSGDGFLKRA